MSGAHPSPLRSYAFRDGFFDLAGCIPPPFAGALCWARPGSAVPLADISPDVAASLAAPVRGAGRFDPVCRPIRFSRAMVTDPPDQVVVPAARARPRIAAAAQESFRLSVMVPASPSEHISPAGDPRIAASEWLP